MLVIVMTALGSMETAISSMRAGAFDFVTKPLDANLLGLAGLARRPASAPPLGGEAAARGGPPTSSRPRASSGAALR